jgi:hypothetical protein
MTEAEWLIGTEATPMVQFIRDRTSDCQLRLFALAVCVASWRGVGPKRREMHAVTEAFADGAASAKEVRRHWGNVSSSWPEQSAAWAKAVLRTRSAVQKKYQVTLARCVFGNPFRPVNLDRGSLTPTIQTLAQAAYEERHPSSKELDQNRLAILKDGVDHHGPRQ